MQNFDNYFENLPSTDQIDIVIKTIDDLEKLLVMKEKYGILRFFRKDFWKLVERNPNRLKW